MRTFVLEVYVPRSRRREFFAAAARARSATRTLRRQGVAIAYIRSLYLDEDETCFHVFQSSSEGAVLEAATRALLGRARVMGLVETTGRRES